MVEGAAGARRRDRRRLGRRPRVAVDGHRRASAGRRRPSSTPGCRAPRAGSCSRWLALGRGPLPARRRQPQLRARPMGDGRSTRCAALGATVRRGRRARATCPVEVARRPAGRRRGRRARRRVEPVPVRAAAGRRRRCAPGSRSRSTTRAGVAAVRRPHRRGDGGASASTVEQPDDRTWVVDARRATGPPTYAVEPDASAASYFFAAAAIAGGRVTVDGPRRRRRSRATSRFVDVLERDGRRRRARRRRAPTVPGTGARCTASTSTCASMSDTAQTLAVVAAFADEPDPGHRASGSSAARRPTASAAVVAELRRLRRRRRGGAPTASWCDPGPIRAGAPSRPTTTTAWR